MRDTSVRTPQTPVQKGYRGANSRTMALAHKSDLNDAMSWLRDVRLETPCMEDTADRWMSDDSKTRRFAAMQCITHACPIFAVCRRAGENEHFGVWGGVDRTDGRYATARLEA